MLPIIPRLPEDRHPDTLCNTVARDEEFFPVARRDLHGEQLDLRPSTSWTATLSCGGGIASRELLEVLAVNAAAPFLLFQGLLPSLRRPRNLAARTSASAAGRFIVNVTSAEGMF